MKISTKKLITTQVQFSGTTQEVFPNCTALLLINYPIKLIKESIKIPTKFSIQYTFSLKSPQIIKYIPFIAKPEIYTYCTTIVADIDEPIDLTIILPKLTKKLKPQHIANPKIVFEQSELTYYVKRPKQTIKKCGFMINNIPKKLINIVKKIVESIFSSFINIAAKMLVHIGEVKKIAIASLKFINPIAQKQQK
ncbi:hypothetical protein IMG5_100710 [Ichthyophthirius multifiliis]|uniref:Uncharacterized protein n=1 Tax=Ichthyophthirius multifiliis TaxID=5932 RepID=G0QSE8_ICHMU|nr:hypothetical protein IMG5_100710 [Ichthyophthirius multifiliis]EGR31849.1 hypothetical protein IMG5_100710 [Ichthyophthirius multifiliis]|eukprot:XP_004035335.1 hypothetical protein IMG5_100710 [Ichthyophthirius multifiliis]